MACCGTVVCSGQVYCTNPPNQIVCSGQTYSTTGTDTIGDGSYSGASGFDWAGFENALGSSISGISKGLMGQPGATRLPNGQILLPNGQLVGGTVPGSSSMILIIGAILLIFLLMRK